MKKNIETSVIVAVTLIIAIASFLWLYEIYQRPGWVDAGMYAGYTINPDLYHVYKFKAHNYQGSRLGYILPMQLCSYLFGHIHGRLAYVISLYSIYVFSILSLTYLFVRGFWERLALIALFTLNPAFISGIFYGGADGAASIQLLLCITLLAYAAKLPNLTGKRILAFLAGIALMLSISSHIFVMVAVFLVIPALFLHSGSRKSNLPMIIGALVALAVLHYLGRKLFGIHRIYLSYSLPWAKISAFKGVGKNFSDPLPVMLERMAFWLPMILAAFYFCVRHGNVMLRTKDRESIGTFVMLTGPIGAYSAYDILTKGNTLVTPAYINLVYPVFLIGLVLLVSLSERVHSTENPQEKLACPSRRKRIVLLLCLAFVSVFVGFSSQHTGSVFSYNKVDSKGLYQAEVAFVERIKSSGLFSQKLRFVFFAAGAESENNIRVYKDFFKGERRYQDYLDSLTALFLWDRAIGLRVDGYADISKLDDFAESDADIVILGRNSDEIDRLIKLTEPHLSERLFGKPECFDDPAYPWCFVSSRGDPSSSSYGDIQKAKKSSQTSSKPKRSWLRKLLSKFQ